MIALRGRRPVATSDVAATGAAGVVDAAAFSVGGAAAAATGVADAAIEEEAVEAAVVDETADVDVDVAAAIKVDDAVASETEGGDFDFDATNAFNADFIERISGDSSNEGEVGEVALDDLS